MSDRLISLLSVLYNFEDYIENGYAKLQQQTHTNWEWVCVDNKSTDNTLKMLQELAKKDSRVKVIPREVNSGSAPGGINTAIPNCTGSYIQLYGTDDELTPDTLEEISKRIDETGADVIIPDAEIVNDLYDSSLENFKMIGVAGKNPANDRSAIISGREAFEYSLNWRLHTWACYSKELMDNCPCFEGAMNGDELWTREMLLKADKVAFSKGTYRYIRHKTSITSKLSMKYFCRFPVEEKIHELVRKNHLGRKYEKIVNNGTMGIYFDYLMKYLTKSESFTDEEKTQIKDILKQGKQIINEYCTPLEIIKNNTKILKYKTIYNIYKYCEKKLRRKNLI